MLAARKRHYAELAIAGANCTTAGYATGISKWIWIWGGFNGIEVDSWHRLKKAPPQTNGGHHVRDARHLRRTPCGS